MVSAVNGLDLGQLGLSPPQAEKKKELGQDEFLNLMVTQLKNQDPFKPLESGEFLGQLAQFGTVSGLAGIQKSFDGLAGSLVSNQALQAAGLVGRTALVESDRGAIAAGGSLDGAVDVPASTGGVGIEIRNAAGQVVRHLQLGPQPAGLTRFHWDGLDDSGAPAAAGGYQLVAGYQKDNTAAAATTLVDAPVDSVVFGADGFTVQLRGIGDLPFSAVREIRNDLP
ncbi:MAG TPA: flagellar hook assembly protein FlgD [Gammaproteobacteria bacterium]|nr:flagellar hook assembly protein FlgD [Gammaproteobacteria bacterium]